MIEHSNNSSFEFRRRTDEVVYLYHRCEDLPSGATWKRVSKDLWVTWVNGFGWAGSALTKMGKHHGSSLVCFD
jgi:hypothetical protein